LRGVVSKFQVVGVAPDRRLRGGDGLVFGGVGRAEPGTAKEKASVLSFVLAGHEPLEVGKALNAEGIAVRTGHHCAQPILRRFGLEATVRPSFAFYNTLDEIDVFINAVRRIAEGEVTV
jgi:cysteine desulfurase/selenocysteine lyase